jgi:predicted transcriptional regulator
MVGRMERAYSFIERVDIIKAVDHLAEERGTARAALIREAIRKLLKDYEEQQP